MENIKLRNIKDLVETYDLKELVWAERALLRGHEPAIFVHGETEGDQLTYLSAALWIRRDMYSHNHTIEESMRRFVSRIRKTIS